MRTFSHCAQQLLFAFAAIAKVTCLSDLEFLTDRSKAVLLLWILSDICVSCLSIILSCLFPAALWSPAGSPREGRDRDSRPSVCGFEPHRRQWVVSMSKTH